MKSLENASDQRFACTIHRLNNKVHINFRQNLIEHFNFNNLIICFNCLLIIDVITIYNLIII